LQSSKECPPPPKFLYVKDFEQLHFLILIIMLNCGHWKGQLITKFLKI
jgi:hypothetical protein